MSERCTIYLTLLLPSEKLTQIPPLLEIYTLRCLLEHPKSHVQDLHNSPLKYQSNSLAQQAQWQPSTPSKSSIQALRSVRPFPLHQCPPTNHIHSCSWLRNLARCRRPRSRRHRSPKSRLPTHRHSSHLRHRARRRRRHQEERYPSLRNLHHDQVME